MGEIKDLEMPEIATVMDVERFRAKDESQGLGLFIRSLIGLDQKAAQDSVAEFLTDSALTAKQFEFVQMIVEQLTVKGAVTAAALYEPPFIDVAPSGPDLVFPTDKVDRLVILLDAIRANAVAV